MKMNFRMKRTAKIKAGINLRTDFFIDIVFFSVIGIQI